MRNLYRGLTSIALLTMMFFVGIGSAFAVPDMPPSVIPVVDDTKGLTAEELMMIGKTANIDDSDVKVYTYITAEIPAEHSGNIETATDEVFTAWRLEQRNGALIYIAKADGKINIQLADTLMESLPSEDMERILSESIIPSLRDDNYANGIASGIRDIKNTVEENTTTSIIPASINMGTLIPYLKWSGIVIGGIAVVFGIIKVLKVALKSAVSAAQTGKQQTEQKFKNELDKTLAENKKLLSQVESMKRSTNSFSSRSSGRIGSSEIDKDRLKEDLMKLYKDDSAAFFAMFAGISGIDENISSKIQDTVNSSLTDSSSIYDGSKVLDSISSSFSSSSYTPSSYSSSYGSGYKTSYGSDFDYSSSYDSGSDSGGDGGGD